MPYPGDVEQRIPRRLWATSATAKRLLDINYAHADATTCDVPGMYAGTPAHEDDAMTTMPLSTLNGERNTDAAGAAFSCALMTNTQLNRCALRHTV